MRSDTGRRGWGCRSGRFEPGFIGKPFEGGLERGFLNSVSFYRSCLRPLLFSSDPESAHHLAMSCLEVFGPKLRYFTSALDERLSKTVFGVKFPSPLGLAAGFDKNAVALPGWEWMGFGFAEIGTVTAKAQPGNPAATIVSGA